MDSPGFDDAIKKNHSWLGEFITGNVEPAKDMFSHRDDVSLAGPQATAPRGSTPIARGRPQVSETLESAIQSFRGGQVTAFDNLATYATMTLATRLR